jgi:hypothetical protein
MAIVEAVALSIGAPIGLVEVPEGKRGLIRFRGKRLVLTDSAYYVWLHGLAVPTFNYLATKAEENFDAGAAERLRVLVEQGLIVQLPSDETLNLDRLSAYPLGMGLGRASDSEEDFVVGDTAGNPLMQVDGVAYSVWSDLIPGEALVECAVRLQTRFSLEQAAASARLTRILAAFMKARLLTLDELVSSEAAPEEKRAETGVRLRIRSSSHA